MVRDNVVKMYGKEFPCVDGGFAPNEPVDVVIRPEDIDIVPVEQGQLVGTVTNVTFKGMQYDIIVDFRGFKWLIQTTDHSPVGARIGVKNNPQFISFSFCLALALVMNMREYTKKGALPRREGSFLLIC